MLLRNLFKRKNDTVVDLTDLQRRGIIKQKKTESSVVDLTNEKSSESSSGVSALGFLGSLAGSAGESEGDEVNMNLSITGKQKLKGILRDMKGDMKNTTDKIYKITDRLDLIEKKLERLERRAGYS